MGLLSHLTALLLAAATASSSLIPAAAAAAASAAAASPSPRISSISFSGNGCPKDPKHSGGFTDPTFTYHGFALALPGANRTANCQVHVQATTGAGAAGWQVALRTNSVRGHVVLSPGTRLEYYTSVFFSQEAGKTDTIRGQIENDGSTTINKPVTLVSSAGEDKVWSPCTGSDGYTGIMNVNFRGRLAGEGKAYFEALSESWDLEWRRC